MKKLLPLLVSLLLLCSCASVDLPEGSDAVLPSDDSQNNLTIIPNPYKALFGNGKNPWDMEISNGYLYVGAGDYDVNVSPKKLSRYSLAEQTWQDCGDIPDEQIDRFLTLNGELYIPGTDPTGDWSMGNFYKLENNELKTYRTINGAVHCFDLELFDGKLFAAVGIKDGGFPVSVSEDGGNTFSRVAGKNKTGSDRFPAERCYDLFVLNETLYAIYSSTEVYRYNGSEFVFECDWSSRYAKGYPFYTPIGADAVFNGRFYFTSGYLFFCDNVNDLRYIIFEDAVVTDIAVYGDSLYALCSKKTENGYLIVLTKSLDGISFESIYTLEYPMPAISFALNGTELYLGIGDFESNGAVKGNILKTNVFKEQ